MTLEGYSYNINRLKDWLRDKHTLIVIDVDDLSPNKFFEQYTMLMDLHGAKVSEFSRIFFEDADFNEIAKFFNSSIMEGHSADKVASAYLRLSLHGYHFCIGKVQSLKQ